MSAKAMSNRVSIDNSFLAGLLGWGVPLTESDMLDIVI
jgi:hypothetical protein